MKVSDGSEDWKIRPEGVKEMLDTLKRLVQEEEGQGMAEYGLILALVAIVVIATLTLLGGKIKTVFENISSSL